MGLKSRFRSRLDPTFQKRIQRVACPQPHVDDPCLNSCCLSCAGGVNRSEDTSKKGGEGGPWGGRPGPSWSEVGLRARVGVGAGTGGGAGRVAGGELWGRPLYPNPRRPQADLRGHLGCVPRPCKYPFPPLAEASPSLLLATP